MKLIISFGGSVKQTIKWPNKAIKWTGNPDIPTITVKYGNGKPKK